MASYCWSFKVIVNCWKLQKQLLQHSSFPSRDGMQNWLSGTFRHSGCCAEEFLQVRSWNSLTLCWSDHFLSLPHAKERMGLARRDYLTHYMCLIEIFVFTGWMTTNQPKQMTADAWHYLIENKGEIICCVSYQTSQHQIHLWFIHERKLMWSCVPLKQIW